MVTEADIDKAIESFRVAYAEALKLPDQTRAAFDQLIPHLRVAQVAGVVAPASPLGVVGITLIDAERKRDQILAGLDELLGYLKQAAEGIAAPYRFIRDAGEWLRVGAKVREARNAQFAEGDLEGYWEGTASRRYAAARRKQDTALATLDAMCKEVHDSLLALSESGRQFYDKVTSVVTDLLIDFVAALAEIVSVVGAVFGISDAINLATDGAKALFELLRGTLELAAQHVIVRDLLENVTNEPHGLPGNKWPPATAAAYSDASRTDGTPSSWKVSE